MNFFDENNPMDALDLLSGKSQALNISADLAELTGEQVLGYLLTHPDFFAQYAQQLVDVSLPAANGNMVSLAHWQTQTLRKKADLSASRLEELLAQATNNQKTHEKLFGMVMHWLAQNDAQALPAQIESDLQRIFELHSAKVIVWQEDSREIFYPYAQSWSDGLVGLTKAMYKPYCGAKQGIEVENLLDNQTASLAMIPLWHARELECVGVMLLGSNDAARFTPDMGTHFLHSIALMAGAALSRVSGRIKPSHLTLKK